MENDETELPPIDNHYSQKGRNEKRIDAKGRKNLQDNGNKDGDESQNLEQKSTKRKHQKRIAPYRCGVVGCEKEFNTAMRFKEHMGIHAKTAYFSCRDCNTRFSREIRFDVVFVSFRRANGRRETKWK